jgi:hypothetical protein
MRGDRQSSGKYVCKELPIPNEEFLRALYIYTE